MQGWRRIDPVFHSWRHPASPAAGSPGRHEHTRNQRGKFWEQGRPLVPPDGTALCCAASAVCREELRGPTKARVEGGALVEVRLGRRRSGPDLSGRFNALDNGPTAGAT
ncbi:hypothetical protein GCM10009610_69570 [Pseudonocardia xinjiangensis]